MQIADLFSHIFEPALLRELEQKATYTTLQEGDTLLHIGQTVRIIPLVLSGTLKISRMDEDGRELLLYYINPSQSCAMTFTCCMQQYPSEVKVTAEDEVTLFAIPIQAMDEWMTQYPTWKSFVMKTIRNRFNELLHAIDQLAFQKLDERLVHYLREKSNVSGSTLINISHDQIATELASSREVISRLLKKLEIDNKLLLYRNQIKLLRDF